jgi:hypothetical protein
MAINQDVQDLILYPGVTKRVTLDVTQIVPTGTGGDEKLMLVASTTAYSDNEARTAIQDMYVMYPYVGWLKSSGLAGVAGKFNLTATSHRLGISMDATVSGTYTYNNQAYYEIALDYNTDATLKTGEDIAVDMQDKIRSIECVEADKGFQLAYKNADVVYTSGKFYITSGTIGSSYVGSERTSVSVAPAQTNDCTTVLGFTHFVSSEDLWGNTIAETAITADYATGSPTLMIGLGTGAVDGDSMYITDGTNYDYFTAITVSGNTVTVPTSSVNDFDGIKHAYTVAAGSYVQVLRKQDPDNTPNNYLNDMDGLLRYMSKCMINQIDFSS